MQRGAVINERYVLIRSVGSGAMGEVCAAWRLEDHILVAIKCYVECKLAKNISKSRGNKDNYMALAIGDDMSLLHRKQNNPMSSLVFSDGAVKEVRRNGDQVTLVFQDYCNSIISILFLEVSRLVVDENIAREEVMDVQFYWTGSSWVASFRNDDQETILEISYKTAKLV